MIKGLPEKLKEQRIKLGFSQKQIADKIKVSPSIISGYETGERTPSVEILLQLSYVFNCSIDYLLGRNNMAPKTSFCLEGLTDRQIKAISELIESMKK